MLGVSGGIAAYKAVELCRRLVDAGAHVVPVLTAGATRFVGEATFSALASEPARAGAVRRRRPDPSHRPRPAADLVARSHRRRPGVIGAYAAGISSDLLVATLLATRAPVLVCPAMHTEMWEHPAVQENLATLRRRGVHVLEPETRPPGRRGRRRRTPSGDRCRSSPRRPGSSPASRARLETPCRFRGRRVLVTAGGTREPIDPVRFLSNRSSGKQGHALAEAADELGATSPS